MDLDKMLTSGKYDDHVIESARVVEVGNFEHVRLSLIVRDVKDRYKEDIRLAFYASKPEEADLLFAFASGNKGRIALEQLAENLVGKHYLVLDEDRAEQEPRVAGLDFDSDGKLHLSPDFAKCALYDDMYDITLDHLQITSEGTYPVKPFESFAEEKKFRRQYSPGNRIERWATAPDLCEKDISQIIKTFNELDFVYTNEYSHSGTPNDHLIRDEGREGVFEKLGHSHNYAEGLPEHAGWILFKADEQNPNYDLFRQEVAKLPGVDIIDIEVLGEETDTQHKVLYVKADDSVIQTKDLDAYQKNMENKWAQVLSVINEYVAKQ